MDNKNAAAFGAANLGTVILYQAVVNVETGITFITGNNHFVPLYFLYRSQNFLEMVSKPHLRSNGCVAGLR
jgi:hypothetical protein